MANHTVIFGPPNRPITADEVAAIYGMTVQQLVQAILRNEGGKYDRLYKRPAAQKKGAANADA